MGEASDSLRTAQQDAGQLLRRRSRNWARLRRAWRSIPEAFRAGGRSGDGLLATSKPARSSAAMTTRPGAPAALSCVRVSDRHQLVDRRGEIPVGGRNELAILPHHLQAQLDRLARIRLRFFQGFAIGNHRGELGAGDREPTFGLGPEASENKRQALTDLTSSLHRAAFL
jgi:hypothetical protein